VNIDGRRRTSSARSARTSPWPSAQTSTTRSAALTARNPSAKTGGKNVSALHWDLICDLRGGGRLTADDVVLQEDGHFKL
jgi:hypothetical protein